MSDETFRVFPGKFFMPVKKNLLMIFVAGLLMMSSLASADTINWSNVSGGYWETPANWTPHKVPVPGDNAVISSAGSCAVTVNSINYLSSLTVGGDCKLSVTAGKITVSSHVNEILLPPVGALFDYQLGGAYTPPAGVQIVSRDRLAPPAIGIYNICYVNGFQTQPDEEGSWEYDLILRDGSGNPIIDEKWNEMLLDVSTEVKRSRISIIIGGWIEKCAADGFKAVEIDNLDSYSRSGSRITQDNAVAFMGLLSTVAHGKDLAIAQKNSTEILGRKTEMGTDFAVAEECSHYEECGDYVDYYGTHVLMIEYEASFFDQGCSAYGATHSIVLRDNELVPQGSLGYVYQVCPPP
jgi:hypothetical protein